MDGLEGLSIVVSDYLFGEKLDSPEEDLFLDQRLDSNDRVHSELIKRVESLYPTKPDDYVLHVYHRKAGFPPMPKGEFKFCSFLVLSGFQYFNIGPSRRQIVKPGEVSKLFDMSVWTPSITKNLILIKLGNGKATLKDKKFRAIVLWLYWRDL